MKSFLFLLALCFGLAAPLAVAQENPAAPAAVPVAIAPTPAAPAPAPAPAPADAPKVTARKPDEDETETPAPAAAAPKEPNPNLNWLQRQVAAATGIPTETSNAAALAAITAERDSLRQQLSTSQAAVNAANASATAAQSAADSAQSELAEMNGFLTQLREAAPSALAPRAADAPPLTPAQTAAATSITVGVAAQLRAIGQPAAQLPGPGSALAPEAGARERQEAQAAFAAETDPVRKAVLARALRPAPASVN